MRLRQGKTRAIINASIDSALLAVEVYNKPRTVFRSEAYISLMIMAWTRLFHAYFNHKGIKYFEKDKQGRFIRIDDEGRIVSTGGEFRTWGLRECIKNYKSLDPAIKENIKFFIGLRNKIEHRHIDKREVDILIFGECQSLLYNYENLIAKLFGDEYSINESLVYSLQFSKLRTNSQQRANNSILSKDMKDVVTYIKNYRNGLADEIYSSQEYSIKLVIMPKITNTSKADEAMTFVKWDELSEEDRKAYEKIAVIIKDRKIYVEGANIKKLKPSEVWKKVNEKLGTKIITGNLHVTLFKLFSIRPLSGAEDPFDTKTEFCLFDETHNDYVYQEAWVEFLIHFFQTSSLSAENLREMERKNQKLKIEDYKIG